jgi:hypothetical protein
MAAGNLPDASSNASAILTFVRREKSLMKRTGERSELQAARQVVRARKIASRLAISTTG